MKKLILTVAMIMAVTGASAGCSDDDVMKKNDPLAPSTTETEDDMMKDDTAVDARFDVYLCLGQSNMEGNATIEEQDKTGVSERFVMMCATAEDKEHNGREMGKWYTATPPLCRWYTGLTPADYFGRTLVEALPENVKVGVIMVACGGISIDGLDKEKYKDYFPTAANWLQNFMNAYDGYPYGRLVELARKAIEGGANIRGILLHQGETNNMQKDWPEKVKKVYTDLLTDLNLKAENVPLLIGEMLDKEQGGVCWGHNEVIATMPSVIPTSHVVSSKGCPGREDGLHFTAEGYRMLGKNYAKVMLELLEK